MSLTGSTTVNTPAATPVSMMSSPDRCVAPGRHHLMTTWHNTPFPSAPTAPAGVEDGTAAATRGTNDR